MKKINIQKALKSKKLYAIMWIEILIILVLLCILIRFKVEWTKSLIEIVIAPLALAVVGAYIYDQIKAWSISKKQIIPYLTFEADSMQELQLSKEVFTLEYSVGKSEWKELGTEKVEFGGKLGKLLIRGKSRIGTNDATFLFFTKTKVVCTGDIRTLVDYSKFSEVDTSQARFERLFQNCKQLVVAPELPAENLAEKCYVDMFSGCTSLKRAPKLPAKSLSIGCYSRMFCWCTSLEEAPELPAENLADGCYHYTFSGCTSLEKAPKLPAISLAAWCYSNMFLGCSSLKYAPILSAKNMAESCCRDMFYGCYSLKEAPKLPAENLAKECYCYMFFGCASLEEAPELPAENLTEGCYGAMFAGCTSLEKAPKLPAKNLADHCYSGMLSGCASLKEAPKLPAENLVKGCYWKMFSGCTSLNEITMMAIRIDANSCLDYWNDEIALSGTFYKNKNAKWNNDGVVPQGWTVKLIEP